MEPSSDFRKPDGERPDVWAVDFYFPPYQSADTAACSQVFMVQRDNVVSFVWMDDGTNQNQANHTPVAFKKTVDAVKAAHQAALS